MAVTERTRYPWVLSSSIHASYASRGDVNAESLDGKKPRIIVSWESVGATVGTHLGFTVQVLPLGRAVLVGLNLPAELLRF